MSIVAAMVDQREPTWVQQLTFGGAMTTVTMLEHGDVLATTDDGALLAIERKTPSDLLNSVRSGRLWIQLAGIRLQTPWAYLIVQGTLAPSADGGAIVGNRGRGSGWTWASIQGALLKAQELGVMVVQAQDGDFEGAVLRLSERSHRAEMPVEPVRTPRLYSDAETLLAALPGIGLDRAQALLAYSETAAWALNWLTDPDAPGKVDGVGPRTREAVRQALGLRDDEALCVIVRETEEVRERQ